MIYKGHGDRMFLFCVHYLVFSYAHGSVLNLCLVPTCGDICDWLFQGGLYGTLQTSVNGFRAMVGAPDTPKWNAVLFGGEHFNLTVDFSG